MLDQIGITLDGDVSSAPETNGALTSGSFQITGPQPNGFSEAEATQLQNVLKFGSLPLTFQLQSELYISPQTGHASLDAGLLAGILGLALVVIYLFYYYRGLGIVSVSSLLIAALLAYFSVVLLSKYQNFTMSLSAIAGLVVAIGITADSFIVYFERLRDEVRDGKALRPAVEAGWKRARRTILVSDTVSFLAAVLLYHFATSDVQGFAYTLGLTTIIDVIVVFLFTKPMVTLLAGTKFFSSGNKWSGLDPEQLGAKTPTSGNKYVLGPAVVQGTEISSVDAALDTSNNQWVVNITLNSAGASAFGTMTTNQYDKYYAGLQSGNEDDAALDQIGIMLDGDVPSAPGDQRGAHLRLVPDHRPAAERLHPGRGDPARRTSSSSASLPLTFTQQSEHSISPQSATPRSTRGCWRASSA